MNCILLFLRRLTRPAYRVRGFARMADLVRRYFARRQREIVIHDFDGTLSFACDLDEHIGSSIFWRGGFSTDQLAVLERHAAPSSVFIDAGANQGEFTLFAAKRLTAGLVLAFEPSAPIFGRLEANVARNGFSNVRLFRKGLAREEKTARLFSDNRVASDGTRNAGLPSLYAPAPSSRGETIELISLDRAVQENCPDRVDIIKIDVEGAEREVLEGAADTLRRFRPLLLVELAEETCRRAGYRAVDIIAFLERYGYRVEIIRKGGRTAPYRSPNDLCAFQNIVCLYTK